ncbi:hypothetical protein [Microvirga mediterraneensis]|uniref:Holin of 3TMs, for gene-transfer release n=1 Tax=Microvirga mediterraneensis TaxID=2754695 RepID=A0A838BWQ8_9HYPH|nr:hypothetical protein [Microvirga mediterraneensis]MBA1159343.1 hypothetical protein [Microvirga mediterraneensis]
MIPIVGLLLQYAPELIGLFAGKDAGVAAGRVADVAKVVFGTDDPQKAQDQIALNPALAEAFAEQARSALEVFRLEIQDAQDARQQTITLAQTGSAISWGAPLVSVLVTLMFGGALYLVLAQPLALDERQATVANILLGVLGAAMTQVINYWLGSSSGSKRSGDAVRTIAERAIAETVLPTKGR